MTQWGMSGVLRIPIYAANTVFRGSAPWSSSHTLVLLVGDVLTPRDGVADLVVLLHGDVDHEPVGGGAAPVVLTGLEEHAVAGTDFLDRVALALAQADPFG